MAQAVTVTSPLGPGKLNFQNMKGREELGRLFELRVELLSEDGAIALDKVLGQNITLTIAYTDDRKRYFNGDVVEFRQLTKMVDKNYCYEALLRPRLWFLTCTSDCKIFQKKSAPDIIKAVLDDHGITDVKKSLSGTYNPREYCVQYDETDFDFISRLMEEEGIYYYFEHDDGKHTLVLADSLSAHQSLPGESTLPFMLNKPGYAKDLVSEWTVRQQVQSGKYVHTDYDFTKPRTDLKSQSQISRTHGHAGMEIFHYPGEYLQSADGTTLARTRIEELQSGWEIADGRTNAQMFSLGKLFKLKDHKREDQNREYLVTVAEYDLRMETSTAAGTQAGQVDADMGVYFDCRFSAIFSQRPFRTACTTPRPIVKGPLTAVVVGKSGEEIWTDQYGRVKVQFYWDRYGQKDENSSCWLRVAQVWAGKNWGGINIPRIGEEVIVEFLSGNPDEPIVTGRVYNAEQKVPYDLPANQTQSGVKTRSTKEGDGETYNELRFEDKKGEEQVYFHAEKNFDRVVENNDTLKVGFDKKDAGDQTIDIYNNRTTTLEKGTDKLEVKEKDRVALIDKGNDELTISQGNQTVTISQGNQSVTISQGNMTIQISAGKGSIEAAQELLLKVGESSIKITPSSIELTSVNIKQTANGQLEATAPQAKITGSGMLDLNGGMITLN
jgi:type VI secretion system secreted protein VgrG